MSKMRDSDHELAIDAILAAMGDHLPAVRSLVGDVIGCAEILAMDYPEGWDDARRFLKYVAEHGHAPS